MYLIVFQNQKNRKSDNMKILDGNKACSNVAYLLSEICSIYPITPSSPMASQVDLLSNKDTKNLYNQKVKVVEMQSEAGAAGTLHGALITGSLASTFTSSQGILLMIPNMYKIAGEMLPGVIHCASRTIATHALSIFGDHTDVYAASKTGFCMLSSFNVEEANHLAAVAHLSAISSSLPFLHFFDGFRTSHEINTIDELKDTDILKLVDYEKISEFKSRSINDGNQIQKGMAQNEDIYFQSVEARNKDYDNVADIVSDYMQKINEIKNTNYAPFEYYGAKDATRVIVAMGSVIDTIKLVVDKLNETNEKVGVIGVRLFRPFSQKYLLASLPKTVTNIAVLDRSKDFSGNGEALYQDVKTSVPNNINVVGGRYGLSSKNTTPAQINAVFQMLKTNPSNNFTIGIEDDVTNLSLKPIDLNVNLECEELKIYGFGSDGMVSASKNTLEILHDSLNKYVQGYFQYDSKKSGGITISHLRISDHKINAPYYVTNPKIVVVTKDAYFDKISCLDDIAKDGYLLINTVKNPEELNELLTDKDKMIIKDRNITTITINAEKIAMENNINGKINKIMQLLILKLLNVNNYEELIKESIKKVLSNKGNDIVNNNINALTNIEDKITVVDNFTIKGNIFNREKSIYDKINALEGNNLKVSDLVPFKTGTFPNELSKYEKRKISNVVPSWIKENCTTCGICALVCPHAVIRPIVDKENEKGITLLGNSEYKYEIIISEADCTGCGLCVQACPGKAGNKALELTTPTYEEQDRVDKLFETHQNDQVMDKFTIKGSQLCNPRFEFSGACAGCGETPYIKLLTQLYQDKITIANATGCSSIYAGSIPSTPYSINWANSLFEDAAEFGLGMHLTYQEKHKQIEDIIAKSYESVDNEVKRLYDLYQENKLDYNKIKEIVDNLKNKEIPNDLKNLLNYMTPKTVWVIGGDGWAYDIGFGGLDHILSTNENIKILVLDTEVYSNTGGQASKSSKMGQVAEFANEGKKTFKKDLFRIAMAYPNCYVASVSLGANYFQTLKAFKEADAHNGPSIIIAYSPCVEQGIKGGMTNALEEQKLSVEAGYNLLMRYNPEEEKLYLDSKEPNFELYEQFINNERRYKTLLEKDENLAKELLAKQIEFAKKRYEFYKKIAN